MRRPEIAITLALSMALGGLSLGCGDDGSTTGAGAGGSGGNGGTGGGGGDVGCPTEAQPAADVVITDRGAVRGVADGETMSFLGIPYAAPPLGALRFGPAEPHACYEGTLEASSFGPACPQYALSGGQLTLTGEEDCLTLNVWTPAAGESATPRPVMFFIHGGGNIQGSGSQLLPGGAPTYGGRRLASAHDVVVVTINYRLGALGFLATSELQAEGNGRAGNYGITDQLQALQWVQHNIAAFGGDPERVMIFGESAGGVNVCTLLATPSAAGLFHSALIQSGGCVQPQLADVLVDHDGRVDDSSCAGAADRLACLRELSAEALMMELPGGFSTTFDPMLEGTSNGYGPLVDGDLLPQSPYVALSEGNHQPVPIVFGSNAEELAQLITSTVTTEAEYIATIEAAFAANGQAWVDAVLATYPAASYATPQAAMVDVFSDLRFTCPTRAYARAAVNGGSQPVYRYWFSRQATTAMGSTPAAHGIELLYVFGSMHDIPGFTPASEDAALSESMMGYWARLASGADPNGASAEPWPAYNATTDPMLVLDAPLSSAEDIKKDVCDMWDNFYLGLQP